VNLTRTKAGKIGTERIGVSTSETGKVAGEIPRKALSIVNSAQELETTAEIGTAAIEVGIELAVPPRIVIGRPEASVLPHPTKLVIFLTFRTRNTQSLDRKCKLLGRQCTRSFTNALVLLLLLPPRVKFVQPPVIQPPRMIR
jgi:hypothetical protein